MHDFYCTFSIFYYYSPLAHAWCMICGWIVFMMPLVLVVKHADYFRYILHLIDFVCLHYNGWVWAFLNTV